MPAGKLFSWKAVFDAVPKNSLISKPRLCQLIRKKL